MSKVVQTSNLETESTRRRLCGTLAADRKAVTTQPWMDSDGTLT